MTVENIRERFRAVGLGSTLPRPGSAWTRLGDHIRWLDLIGIGDGGFSLHCDDAAVAGKLLGLAARGVFPDVSEGWLQLAMPLESQDPIQRIIAGLSPRGRQGECEEAVVEAVRRIARRDSSVVEPLLQCLRSDMRHRIQRVLQGGSRRIKNSVSMCSCLIEFGDLEDLELLCRILEKFADNAQLRIVCEIHARGWQREPAFLQALETLERPEIHGLHEAFLHLREGGDLSDLDPWIGSQKWMERQLVLLGILQIMPHAVPSGELLELLLPRIEQEDDQDCSVAVGWALGALLERMDGSAALEVIRTAEGLANKDSCGFHAAMRALMRTRPTPAEREMLLQAMEPLVRIDDSDAAQSVAEVRLHLAQVPTVPWNLLNRLSGRRGWLQDLAEPGRSWDGTLGDVIEGRADRELVLWLCIEPDSTLPVWLRTHLLGRLLEREPETLTVLEQACRTNDNREGRACAAQALFMHSGQVEPDPLYLACTVKDLPVTVPEDSLRNAVHLISWLNDSGMSERAGKFLVKGGPVCREVATHWNVAMITNSYDQELVATCCEKLVELGVTDPPRPLSKVDVHSHAMAMYQWSDAGNDVFLLGDVLALDPLQLAMRLEPLKDLSLLESTCRRLGSRRDADPELVATAWECLNERHDWEGRKAALTLVECLGPGFIQGRTGERRRERLKELLDDLDSDVSNAAKEICQALNIENGGENP